MKPVSSRGKAGMAASAALLLLAPVAGCKSPQRPPPSAAVVQMIEAAPDREWKGVVSAEDLGRLERLQAAWTQALATARTAGASRRVRAEGALLDPQAALPRAELPPGSYWCRMIRIGAAPRGRNAYSAGTRYYCHVGADEGKLSFTKQTGTERPGGYVYADELNRQIFIGALAQGRERIPPAYAANPQRDVVGIVERIDAFRYRLVVPWPRNGAALEVYELVPAIS